jgi:glutathione peroxidase
MRYQIENYSINFVKALMLLLFVSVFPNSTYAEIPYVSFPSIDGGTIETSQWKGKPYLIVNTASRCGFTRQYATLQKLYDRYQSQGFGMIAVPSNDFKQELDTNLKVKEFCELNYGIDMPISIILSVRGTNAHPFYTAIKLSTGFVPSWNFNKILIGANGEVLGTWGSSVRPTSSKIITAVEAALNRGL